jgi:hypothetical protein
VRALSSEEAAALRGRHPGYTLPANDPRVGIAEKLLARGLVQRSEVEQNGKRIWRWRITPLGLLALRVAVAIPAVQP